MRFKKLTDLPESHVCRKCGKEKPLAEIVVVLARRSGHYLLRWCKECKNSQERGHRREWKREYLRNWRKRNPDLTADYWSNPSEERKRYLAARAHERFLRLHHPLLIQGRLRRHGIKVTIFEAVKLYKKFGPCYPSPQGLTPKGLRECERIRGSHRREKAKPDHFQIRLMVYEDGLFIKPSLQKVPYQSASKNLKRTLERRMSA